MGGKEHRLGLGSLRIVSLSEARLARLRIKGDRSTPGIEGKRSITPELRAALEGKTKRGAVIPNFPADCSRVTPRRIAYSKLPSACWSLPSRKPLNEVQH